MMAPYPSSPAFQPARSRGALVPVPNVGRAREEDRWDAGIPHVGPRSYSPFVAQLADQATAGARGPEWRARLGRAATAYASAASRGRTRQPRSEMNV